jgi:hypothetical protein
MAYKLAINVAGIDGVPLAANLVAGTISIYRVRVIAGVEDVTLIVDSDFCDKDDGQVFYEYQFPRDQWETSDQYRAEFSGQAVTVLGTTYPLPPVTLQGNVGSVEVTTEWADVPVNITAIPDSETDILNLLLVPDAYYQVEHLRIWSDPGWWDPSTTDTIIIRLYERINDALVQVDSFEINTGNYYTYFTLMELFGLAHLAGRQLQVTAQATGLPNYPVAGQYNYVKTTSP